MTRKTVYWMFLILAVAGSGCAGGGGSTQRDGVQSAVVDVVGPADGVRVGSGWYQPEEFNNDRYRWAANDAEIIVCPDARHRELVMQLEPGPSLGSKSLALQVRSHAMNRTVSVPDRRPVHIELPPNPIVQVLKLHAASKNIAVPGEKRLLNFRLFSAALAGGGNCGADIVPDGSAIKVGKGWYPVETFGGETFRWAKNDAEVVVEKPALGAVLEFEVAPGPALGRTQLLLHLYDGRGRLVSSTAPILGRSFVTMQAGNVTAHEVLTLRVSSPNREIANDSRILNFRVFEMHTKT